MTLHERPSTDRVLAGRYRLGARRGAGFDIAVFDGTDLGVGRSVVVKLVHPDLCEAPGFEERFRSVLQRVASIEHPNVGRVLDWGSTEWNGRAVQFVVTEVLTGGSVRDLLDRGRVLTPSQVVVIGLDACRGLDVAHRLGVVHGDIRPSTLVFGGDGTLRVVDLGFARIVSEGMWADPAHIGLDRAKYASPEQAAGLPVDAKSDVYSLCLVLIELLTGQLPFVGDSSVMTLQNRIDRLMPVSADFGPLAALLERAGRPDPGDRSTAAELGRALVQAAEKLPRPAPISLPGSGLFTDAAAPRTSGGASAPAGAAAPVTDGATDQGPTAGGVASLSEAAAATLAAAFAPPAGQVPVETAPPSATPLGTPRPPVDPSGEVPRPDGAAEDDLAVALPDELAPRDVDGERRVDEPTTVAPVLATTVMPAVEPTPAPVQPPAPSTAPAPAARPASAATPVPPPPRPQVDPPLLAERRSRRKLLGVLLVVVLAAAIGGLGAWWLGRNPEHTVPPLVGLEQAEALNQISEFDWDTVTTEEASDTVAAGLVIRTDPPAGTKLAEGKPFSIVASNGPAPRALPDLTGLTLDDARVELQRLQLVLQEGAPVNSETVPAGTIVSWSVPSQPGLVAGDTVVPGTIVQVVVSIGAAPRTLPDFTGYSLADTRTALESAGLVLAQLPDEFSATVPVGMVVRQEPAVGQQVPAGGTVSVALSKGPDLVAVPPLADLTVAQAQAALSTAGLGLGTITGDPTGFAVLAEVDGQPIGAGAQLPRGTKVDVTFEVPPPPTTVAPETTAAPDTTVAAPDPASTTTVAG